MSISWVRLPALEIRWLARYERQLPVPQIVLCDNLAIDGVAVGGFCLAPQDQSYIYDSLEIPPHSAGTIAVSGTMDIASTLAHEWRHHWQHWNGWQPEGQSWTQRNTDDWEGSIRAYYRNHRSEWDALRYQLLRAPEEYGEHSARICGLLK